MKFIFEGDGGNNIYLDDINIDGPVSLEENNFVHKMSLYPNPANEEVNLSFAIKENHNQFSIRIIDVVGKEVSNVYNGKLAAGNHLYKINTSSYNAGVYFVTINNGISTRLEKLIIK